MKHRRHHHCNRHYGLFLDPLSDIPKREIRLDSSEESDVTIGRSSLNSNVIDRKADCNNGFFSERTLSSKHLKILKDEDGFYVSDQSSTHKSGLYSYDKNQFMILKPFEKIPLKDKDILCLVIGKCKTKSLDSSYVEYGSFDAMKSCKVFLMFRTLKDSHVIELYKLNPSNLFSNLNNMGFFDPFVNECLDVKNNDDNQIDFEYDNWDDDSESEKTDSEFEDNRSNSNISIDNINSTEEYDNESGVDGDSCKSYLQDEIKIDDHEEFLEENQYKNDDEDDDEESDDVEEEGPEEYYIEKEAPATEDWVCDSVEDDRNCTDEEFNPPVAFSKRKRTYSDVSDDEDEDSESTDSGNEISESCCFSEYQADSSDEQARACNTGSEYESVTLVTKLLDEKNNSVDTGTIISKSEREPVYKKRKLDQKERLNFKKNAGIFFTGAVLGSVITFGTLASLGSSMN